MSAGGERLINVGTVRLREVIDEDLPIIFEYELEPESNRMAAFTAEDPADRAAFDQHWAKIRANEAVVLRTVLVDEQVAGYVTSFEMFGEPHVAYWIGSAYWGRGVATEALTQFLRVVTTRPLHARAAVDNVASLRVLKKCGFVISGYDRGFAHGRGTEIEEAVLVLGPLN